ncbi:MAG: NAD(P)/FAD-dependent oxidoreductase [Candidatus Izemoplasmatales bacterium]
MNKKIVVIGAGPAGLTAAYELLKLGHGYEVVVLEATGRIGGIAQTIEHHGNRIDIGGHRFFSKDPAVNAWWEAAMPRQGAPALDDRILGRQVETVAGGPDPEKEDRVMLKRRRVSRIYYLKKFFDYPVTMSGKTIRNLGLFRTFRAGMSYLWASVFKKKEDSLENFYVNRFGRVLYGMFFEDYTTKVWGRAPKDISADWGAQRVKGLSILALLRNIFGKKKGKVETSLITEFLYPKLGPGQLWECVAADVAAMGGTIVMDARVEKIEVKDGRIASVTYAKDGAEIVVEADEFISSMPLKDLVAAIGEAAPAAVREIAGGLPYRDFVTVGLLLPKLNLKNETDLATLGDIVPDCWIYVQETEVRLGRIQVFNNWSPYMVKDPLHTVWVGLEYFCQEGDDFWNLSEAETIELARKELAKMGVIDETAPVLDAVRARIPKAYPAYFDSYARIGEIVPFLDSFDNLWCVGRNGQHRYNNMDHSMVTAFRAVEAIDCGSTDKRPVWEVNTEVEYHEEKQNDGR